MAMRSGEQVLGEGWAAEVAARGELHFRRLLEKLPAGAYTCDPRGRITYFNQQAVALWGRAPKLNDATDRFCGSFKLFASDGSPISHDRCWMALALETNEAFDGHEIVVERPDGQRLTVLAYANPIRNDSGTLIGAVNVLVDISDRKRIEDALMEADLSKNQFLATLAHELRNPLAPIRNAVQILHLDGAVAPESRQALEVIDRQVQQMTRLIDDLLDVARITRNKIELRKERIELAEVLHAAVETSRPLMDSSGHEFVISISEEPIWVHGDLARLAQVVSNLLNNAAKYTEGGGRVSMTSERQGSDAVVTVRDTGIGISAEMIPRVFEMFTQMDRSLERAQGGLGIGLALVKRLVDMHGGTVTVRSDGPGTGSEFVVRLPVLIEAAPEAAVASTREARRRNRAVPVAPLRILIVDDNKDSAASLGMLLKLKGHEIRTAHDGAEAVQLAGEFRPGVTVLDIGLPKLNGYDAARMIRQQPWGLRMILIAATGWGQEADRQRSKEAGFDHHLVKPVDPAELLGLLASLERPASDAAGRSPAI